MSCDLPSESLPSLIIFQLQPGYCNLLSVFSLVRPHIDISFHGILSHINTVFVLRSKVTKVLFTCIFQAVIIYLANTIEKFEFPFEKNSFHHILETFLFGPRKKIEIKYIIVWE